MLKFFIIFALTSAETFSHFFRKIQDLPDGKFSYEKELFASMMGNPETKDEPGFLIRLRQRMHKRKLSGNSYTYTALINENTGLINDLHGLLAEHFDWIFFKNRLK